MATHELLIPDHDFEHDSISEVEDPLDAALMSSGAGEVTGGGIGHGWYRIELELSDPVSGTEIARRIAESLELPLTTLLRRIGEERGTPLRV